MTLRKREVVNTWVIDADILLEIARGWIEWMSIISKFGRASVWATEIDIRDNNSLYTYLETAVQLELSSSLAWDNLAGTWLHTIHIFWLDENYNEINEVLSTHHTDWTIAVTTVNSYLRVYRMTSETAWSAWSVLWVITLETTLGIIQAVADNWNNNTLMSQYTIPAWKTWFLIYWDASVWSWKAATIKFYAKPLTSIFRVLQIFDIFETNYVRNYKVPLRLPEKTDLVVRATSESAWTAISVNYDLILIDNE